MPLYRVHRIKDAARESFRWSPHTGGLALLRPRDYEPGEEIEAANPYATWKKASSYGQPLRPGDVLETVLAGETAPEHAPQLWITKYVGFEPAQWVIAEPKTAAWASSGPSESLSN